MYLHDPKKTIGKNRKLGSSWAGPYAITRTVADSKTTLSKNHRAAGISASIMTALETMPHSRSNDGRHGYRTGRQGGIYSRNRRQRKAHSRVLRQKQPDVATASLERMIAGPRK